jgi:tetratricopeptide (TPR) repeat protein
VTAGSILTQPVESLRVVEEEPALLDPGIEASFGPYRNRPPGDPRLAISLASPRAWLRADRALYDAILVSAPAPWLPSGASLLTLEAYGEMRARLRPGGLVSQRIALSTVGPTGAGSILRTFAAAFPEMLLFRISTEDLLLVGSGSPLRLDDGRIRAFIDGNEAVLGDLSRALVIGPNELLMALRIGGEGLRALVGDGPVNRDDHSTAALESLRDMRIHDNQALLGLIDDAGRDALLPVLVNYGEGTEREAPYLYALAKSYLGIATDPGRAEAIAVRLSALGEAGRAAWVRGEALVQRGDYDAALRAWESILEADPDNLDALFSLGMFHLERRDHYAADRYLAPAARRHPEASIVLYQHGGNLFALDRYAEATAVLERARHAAGAAARYPLIDYMVGISALHLGRTAEAERALTAYLDWAYAQKNLTALEVEVHGRLAEVYDRKGDPNRARQEREKGMRLRVAMREFARTQGADESAAARSALVLPNPAAARPAPSGDGRQPGE